MCLAIAPEPCSRKGPLGRTWRRLAQSPMRLYLTGGLFHLSVLLPLWIAGRLPAAEGLPLLTYGVIALPVLGYLVAELPRRYSLSPVHYARYTGAFGIMMLALGLLEAAAFVGGGGLTLVGLSLMPLAWWIILQGLRDLRPWIPERAQAETRWLSRGLFALFALLVISVAFDWLGDMELTVPMALVSLFLLWPSVLVLGVRSSAG